MHPLIDRNRPALAELCQKHRVRSLDLFGSAAGDAFDPATSDLDFVVESRTSSPGRSRPPTSGFSKA